MYYRWCRLWRLDIVTSGPLFAGRPINLILQDIEWGRKLHEEELHLQELGIATLSSLTLNLNRDPKSKPVKSIDFCHFMRSDSGTFESVTCNTVSSLLRDSLMPAFFLEVTPPEITQALIDGKSGTNVSSPRAFIGDELALISPSISNGFVFSPFGCVNTVESGTYLVRDVDDGTLYEVDYVPDSGVEFGYAFDECSWSIRRYKSLIIT